MISIVVPTLNEAAELGATLDAARAACPGAELIVVDGGSIDATRAIASAGGAAVIAAERGRGRQLRAGALAARGACVLLLHADTRLPPSAGAAATAALARPGVVAGAFRLRFRAPDRGRLPAALRAYERLLDWRSTMLGWATGDQAIFAHAAALRAVGGVPDVPIFEDVQLCRALRAVGRVVLLDDAVQTSARLFLRHGTVRVAALHAAYRVAHAAGVPPDRLAAWYPLTSSG